MAIISNDICDIGKWSSSIPFNNTRILPVLSFLQNHLQTPFTLIITKKQMVFHLLQKTIIAPMIGLEKMLVDARVVKEN